MVWQVSYSNCEAAIINYTHTCAVEGGKLLAREWGTELLFADTSRFGAMVDVRVPPWPSNVTSANFLESSKAWMIASSRQKINIGPNAKMSAGMHLLCHQRSDCGL